MAHQKELQLVLLFVYIFGFASAAAMFSVPPGFPHLLFPGGFFMTLAIGFIRFTVCDLRPWQALTRGRIPSKLMS